MEKLKKSPQKGGVGEGLALNFQIENPHWSHIEDHGKRKPTWGEKNFYDHSIQNGTVNKFNFDLFFKTSENKFGTFGVMCW